MRFATAFSDRSLADTEAARRAAAQAQKAAVQAYHDHNDRLRPLLPPSIRQLMDNPYSRRTHSVY